MSEASLYFIRARGRISGPFDVPTLQKLARRGSLSRAHEVSQDRADWTPAGEFEELFPASAAGRGASVSPPAPLPDSPPPAAGFATAAIADAPATRPAVFHYAHGGVPLGPVPMAVLQSLAASGALGEDDPVWSEESGVAMAAARYPELAVAFQQRGRPVRPRGGAPSVTEARQALADAASHSTVAGIVVGVLLLLFLNLPLGRVDGRTYWWWDVMRVPDSGAARVFCVYVLVAGLALCVLSPLVAGVARAVTFVSLSLLGAILMLVLGLSLPSADDGFTVAVLLPVITAALLATTRFRMRAPAVTYGTVWHAVLGGCLAAAMLVSLIVTMLQRGRVDLSLDGGGGAGRGGLPAWLVIAMTLVLVGHATGIVAGICALVSIRSASRGLLRATQACAMVSFVAPAPAALLVTAGLLDLSHEAKFGMWMFLATRAVATVYAIILPLIFGFGELLTVTHFGPVAEAGGPGTAAPSAAVATLENPGD